MEISEKDRLRYGEGDPFFNEDHNRSVIEKTIAKTEANHKLKKKMMDEGLLERSDAVYSYIRHMDSGGNADKTIDEYLGKKRLMEFMGQERLADLKRRAGES